MGISGTVYLLHFTEPISDGHTTQHYIGWAESLTGRISDHTAGRGSRLTKVARERGIGFRVVRVWENQDRNFERSLKNRHEGPRFCPECTDNPVGGPVELPGEVI